jgi:Na+-driven multidrug efflux pump
MGIRGTAIATSITYLLNFLALNYYSSRIHEIQEAWYFPDRNSLKNIKEYLRLGF